MKRLISYIRDIHREGTPDSWARWAGTVFLLLIAGVVIAALSGHVITETIRTLLTDIGYAVLGGSALRKGVEVAGNVAAKWAPKTEDDTKEP